MTTTATLLKQRPRPSTWRIILDTKVSPQDVVASLCRDNGESFILEELRFQELKLASPQVKRTRFETFKAKWQAYATELGLACDTTASFHDMHEQLLAGSWT